MCSKVYVLTNGEIPTGEFDDRVEIITDKLIEVSGENKVEKIHLQDRELEISGIFVALGTS